MGKGDKKTRRGKIIKGTYGVRRPKKKKNTFVPKEKPVAKKTKTTKKAEPKKKETVKKTTTRKTTTRKKPETAKTTAKTTAKETTKKVPAKKPEIKEEVKKGETKAKKVKEEPKKETKEKKQFIYIFWNLLLSKILIAEDYKFSAIFLKTSPLSSKLINISQLEAAGDSRHT